jgi:hypothetical protein
MPVFVEWRFQEKTNTYIVIFHFIDDFSSPNVRMKKHEKGRRMVSVDRFGCPSLENPKGAWMTWAPSHPELGFLMEVLSYANIVNGLKVEQKIRLKSRLEARRKWIVHGGHMNEITYLGYSDEEMKEIFGENVKLAVYVDDPEKDIPLRFGIEICEEYISYLRNLLKPYMS